MSQLHGWSDPLVAQAALSDPSTPTFDLLQICMAHPQLRAGAALHPQADVNLLTWIAGQEEPVAAATASSRLAQAQTPLQPPPVNVQPEVAAAPALTPPRRRGARTAIWAGAGVLALALVVVVAVLVVPRLTSSGTYAYAPDLRELPGLVSVDAQQGLPKTDAVWSTYFAEAPEAGFLIAANSTSAYGDYQSQLSAYNDALASLKQWESDYQSGYASGKVCMSETEDSYYYATRADYCFDYLGSYLNVDNLASQAGFVDSVNGLAASPDQPGNSSYTPPQVPAKPSLPAASGNLEGIELKTGKVAWQVELSSIWPDAHPELITTYFSGDQALLLLGDAAGASSDSGGPRRLAMLNVKSGTVGASSMLDPDGSAVVKLHGDVAILADKDGSLRGLSTTDLATVKWTSSARPYWWSSDESPYWISEIPGGYLLTDEGYLRMTDGQRADFARDAGQDSIQLGRLNGTTDKLIRIQATDSGYDVSGFDTGKDEQTWKLSGVAPDVWWAGGMLIAVSEGEVSAYRVNGDELDRQWRYSCDADCVINFADNARVVISEWKSPSVVVLNTANGDQVDAVKNPDGGSPMVGSSVLYLRQSQRLVARDLTKSGLPTLWRSIPFDGGLSQVGDRFLIESDGEKAGKVGILGLDGDDWNDFRVTEG